MRSERLSDSALDYVGCGISPGINVRIFVQNTLVSLGLSTRLTEKTHGSPALGCWRVTLPAPAVALDAASKAMKKHSAPGTHASVW